MSSSNESLNLQDATHEVATQPSLSSYGKTPEEQIEGAVAAHENVIIGRTNCFYTLEAIGVLSKLGVPYAAYHLDQYSKEEHAALHNELKNLYKQTTVPYIFVDHKFIGGCDDLKNRYNKREFHDPFKHSISKSLSQFSKDSNSSSDVIIDLPDEAPKAYRTMFYYCSHIDNNVARLVGFWTLVICILSIIFRQHTWAHWLMFGLFVDSVLRFFFGGIISPLARASKIIAKLLFEPQPTEGLPKQFAALAATMFSGVSSLLYLLSFDNPENIGGAVVAGLMGGFAFFEASFSFCAACVCFEFAAKRGWMDYLKA